MASVITTTGNTVVSVLGTVNTIATQASRTINTMAAGLDMLDTFVGTARTKQIARNEVELHTFFTELHEDAAIDISRRQKILASELNNDQGLKQLYAENYDNLKTVMETINRKVARNENELITQN